MAFNFNWSPLTADADFYKRAQEMLTTALNKSPKPPIIVDDILVNELNLGSVPPELEILEIGDLAEDRFRGIFKMCYSGDAFLTLKTRVQVCHYPAFNGSIFSASCLQKPPLIVCIDAII
jgi:distribution and morphology protein 34